MIGCKGVGEGFDRKVTHFTRAEEAARRLWVAGKVRREELALRQGVRCSVVRAKHEAAVIDT